jgi:hypothetical protein
VATEGEDRIYNRTRSLATQGTLRRREASSPAGTGRSSRTCRSIGGPCGRPSARRFSPIIAMKERADTHEDTSTALSGGALTTKALDLAIGVHLIVLKDGHLDLLALVLDLLGGLQVARICVSKNRRCKR